MAVNRVLILDNAIDHDRYRPVEHWAPFLLFPADAFRASQGELPKSVDEYSHLIVTGSEASIVEDDDWMRKEEEFIRRVAHSGKVILGSCFGHQLIARAFFGRGAVRRRAKPEIGWDTIDVVISDALMGDEGDVVHSLILHFDEVVAVPGIEVLARSCECEVQAMRIPGKKAWGIQPHPEIGIAEGLAVIEHILPDGPSVREKFLDGRLPPPRDSGWVVGIMRAFQQVG